MGLYAGVMPAAAPIEFSKQIAPIFERHCVRCHGAGNRKGDVSLATSADLQSNELVIAGEPDNSHLIDLVTAQDGELPSMPKEAEPLSEAEVDLLRQWVEEGANWPAGIVLKEMAKADQSWWAYQPLKVMDQSIDDFIRAKLQEHHLTMSPRADRRTLIRRLSFDLHGLPPSPESVEAFVNDSGQNAYKRLVDEMLASSNYGERFAQHWLDLAHYADTHGFERDQRRDHAWRYRDYVIRSLNEDKGYDRFLQEQIAGDILWPDDEQAVIATGFLAAGPWDFVGQVETKSPVLRRAARSLDLDDMAMQVITATMAMTVNCARCHDHKLDPISQQEYYHIRAVFAGVRREDRVVSDAALEKYEIRKQELLDQRNKLDYESGWLAGEGVDLADIVGGGNGFGTGTFRNAIDPRSAKVQTRDFGKLGNVVSNHFSPSAFEFIDGVFVPDGGNGEIELPVSSTGIMITGLPKTSGNAWDMIRNGPVASQHSPELGGIDFTTDGHSLLGLHANAGITFDLKAMRRALLAIDELAVSENSQAEEHAGAALRLTANVGYFGAVGGHCADVWLFVDGRKVAEFQKLRREEGLQFVDIELPATSQFLTLVSTDGGDGYGMDQIGFGDPRVKLAVPPALTEATRRRISDLKKKRRQIDHELELLGPPPRFFGVVATKEKADVRLLTRGNPETPAGDSLSPAAFSALTMLDPHLGTVETGQGERRAALARWVTHPDNPLVRRVIVNRLWQWHFGVGLVDTPSDFGFGGGRPSHPELLDWLAEELLRQNWSLKAIHRLILTSDAYMQTSHVQEQVFSQVQGVEQGVDLVRPMETDAQNRLLWRQNLRRIEAEVIRDSVLFVSDKLNPKRGGPGFEDFTYQDAYAPIYTYVTADDPAVWRRSIYRYIVRTTPNRFLTTLDCPDPANLTPKRLATTTPLQSLALYNNEFMIRQARYFAERIKQQVGEETVAQVACAFGLAFGRQPTVEETRLAVELVEKQGLFTLCRSLFNSNEFVYVD